MSDPADYRKTAAALLEPGEQLISYTAGIFGTSTSQTLIVLTSKQIRVAATAGGPNIAFSNIRSVSWASAWARLNIDLKSPRKRLVFSIYGADWKQRAKDLAEKAMPLLGPP